MISNLLAFSFDVVYTFTPEKAMAPHSSTLAWKTPWTEELDRLQVHGVAKSQTRLNDFTFSFRAVLSNRNIM